MQIVQRFLTFKDIVLGIIVRVLNIWVIVYFRYISCLFLSNPQIKSLCGSDKKVYVSIAIEPS